MTEKKFFAYKLFLSWNISDFIFFFFVKIAPPPWKKSPPLSQQSPSWKFIWRFSPPSGRGGGVHTHYGNSPVSKIHVQNQQKKILKANGRSFKVTSTQDSTTCLIKFNDCINIAENIWVFIFLYDHENRD